MTCGGTAAEEGGSKGGVWGKESYGSLSVVLFLSPASFQLFPPNITPPTHTYPPHTLSVPKRFGTFIETYRVLYSNADSSLLCVRVCLCVKATRQRGWCRWGPCTRLLRSRQRMIASNWGTPPYRRSSSASSARLVRWASRSSTSESSFCVGAFFYNISWFKGFGVRWVGLSEALTSVQEHFGYCFRWSSSNKQRHMQK